MIHNCLNCGAPISVTIGGGVCDYCGTTYNSNKLSGVISTGSFEGTLKVDGRDFKVYLTNVDITTIHGIHSGRDIHGRLINDIVATKRKFTLVEV